MSLVLRAITGKKWGIPPAIMAAAVFGVLEQYLCTDRLESLFMMVTTGNRCIQKEVPKSALDCSVHFQATIQDLFGGLIAVYCYWHSTMPILGMIQIVSRLLSSYHHSFVDMSEAPSWQHRPNPLPARRIYAKDNVNFDLLDGIEY